MPLSSLHGILLLPVAEKVQPVLDNALEIGHKEIPYFSSFQGAEIFFLGLSFFVRPSSVPVAEKVNRVCLPSVLELKRFAYICVSLLPVLIFAK